jgi:plastocyanin
MPTNRKECIFSAKFAVFILLIGSALTLQSQELVDVTAHIIWPVARGQSKKPEKALLPPAAFWLTPLHANPSPAAVNDRTYTLLQKNKQFLPHLLIVPVGSVVHFPNADPFFHNVFSLFDGRRFDLGLYEAGTTKEVRFGREGISYIFCNIHPEMSAVVIALDTPYSSAGDAQGHFRIRGVPVDDYMLHVWIQGEDEAALKVLTRRVHVAKDRTDLGVITLPQLPHPMTSHENKYGNKYDTPESPVY